MIHKIHIGFTRFRQDSRRVTGFTQDSQDPPGIHKIQKGFAGFTKDSQDSHRTGAATQTGRTQRGAATQTGRTQRHTRTTRRKRRERAGSRFSII